MRALKHHALGVERTAQVLLARLARRHVERHLEAGRTSLPVDEAIFQQVAMPGDGVDVLPRVVLVEGETVVGAEVARRVAALQHGVACLALDGIDV